MTAQEAAFLLGEIASAGAELVGKPLDGIIGGERREHVDFLDNRLEAAIRESAVHRHVIGNFAPLLVKAMRRTIAARAHADSPDGARWESLVGHLIPNVREDARTLLARARE